MSKKIFVTGGAGYVGAELVPALLSIGHEVTVFDLMIFGNSVLSPHPRLTCIKGDLRNSEMLSRALVGQEVVIHLACISNDPSFDLNPELGKSINYSAFRPLVEMARSAGVERFIYASSSSVYGIKSERDVHEDVALEPLTDYSKYKAECEKILLEYNCDDFTTITLRPATVCGFSARQRLDLVVNILTNCAYHERKIKVFGGEQLRPNIHIKDMVRAYQLLIEAPKEKVSGEIYNVGHDNYSVLDLADMVRGVVGNDVGIEVTKTDDLRSYHVSSTKIGAELGFRPKNSVVDAATELVGAFEGGILSNPMNNELYFNIKRMHAIRLV